MGFKVPNRTANIELNSGFTGAEAVCKVEVSLGLFLELQDFENNMDTALMRFGDEVIESWNLENEAGEPIPCDADGMKQISVQLATALIGAWGEAISDPETAVGE